MISVRVSSNRIVCGITLRLSFEVSSANMIDSKRGVSDCQRSVQQFKLNNKYAMHSMCHSAIARGVNVLFAGIDILASPTNL